MSIIDWNADRIAELRGHVAAKISFGNIAALMGVSRNAAIEKAKRLGIIGEGRRRLTDEQRETSRRRKAAASVIRKRNARQAKRQERAVDASNISPSIETPLPRFLGFIGIPFADLRPFSGKRANQCRYIADEPPGPEYRACGNETEDGRQYCPRCWDITHIDRNASNWMKKAA